MKDRMTFCNYVMKLAENNNVLSILLYEKTTSKCYNDKMNLFFKKLFKNGSNN